MLQIITHTSLSLSCTAAKPGPETGANITKSRQAGGSTRQARTPPTGGGAPVLSSLLTPLLQILVEGGGYWVDPGTEQDVGGLEESQQDPAANKVEAKFEIDDSARSYRAHFLGYDHQNFTAVDEEFGPVVLSVKHYTDKEGEVKGNHVRVILRTTSGTIHRLLPYNDVKDTPSPIQLARLVHSCHSFALFRFLCPDLTLDKFEPILSPRASELIVSYDEHVVVNNYKFGLIYQRYGQVTEESLFGNRSHSAAMDKFLDMLGQRIDLSQHNGYKGGLDTVHGQVSSSYLLWQSPTSCFPCRRVGSLCTRFSTSER